MDDLTELIDTVKEHTMTDEKQLPDFPTPESGTPPGIYAAMVAVMKDVGAIAKGQKNKHQGYMFRGIDDAQQALQPALIQHGVFLVPEVIDHRECEIESNKGAHGWRVCVRVKFTFYATDGSSVVAVTDGESIDHSDKATNQAMTAALKCAIFQTFTVPTQETASGDQDNHSPEGKRKVQSKPPAREYPPNSDLDDVGGEPKASDPQRKAIYAKTKGLGYGDRQRKELLDAYNVASSTDLTKKQASEILDQLKKEEEAASATN